MPFVKIHTEILSSTIWNDHLGFRVFMACLLSAKPTYFPKGQAVLEVDSLEETEWTLPAGNYGFARVSGPWLIAQSGAPEDEAWAALRRLASPESESRHSPFEGRRMVRINGGYVVLNFMQYRDMDSTAAFRQRRFRERKAKNAKAYRQRKRTETNSGGDAPVTRGDAPVTRGDGHREGTSVTSARQSRKTKTGQKIQKRDVSRRYTPVTGVTPGDAPVTRGDAPVTWDKRFSGKSKVNKEVTGNILNQPEADTEALLTDNVLRTCATDVARPWSAEACDDWNDRFGAGTAPGDRIGSGLKRIVDVHGWDVVRPAWQRYLAEKDPEFCNPQDFASKLTAWLGRRLGKDAATAERSRAAITEWLGRSET